MVGEAVKIVHSEDNDEWVAYRWFQLHWERGGWVCYVVWNVSSEEGDPSEGGISPYKTEPYETPEAALAAAVEWEEAYYPTKNIIGDRNTVRDRRKGE